MPMSEHAGITWQLSSVIDPGPAAYSSLAAVPAAAAGGREEAWMLAYESGTTDPINYDTIRFATSE